MCSVFAWFMKLWTPTIRFDKFQWTHNLMPVPKLDFYSSCLGVNWSGHSFILKSPCKNIVATEMMETGETIWSKFAKNNQSKAKKRKNTSSEWTYCIKQPWMKLLTIRRETYMREYFLLASFWKKAFIWKPNQAHEPIIIFSQSDGQSFSGLVSSFSVLWGSVGACARYHRVKGEVHAGLVTRPSQTNYYVVTEK